MSSTYLFTVIIFLIFLCVLLFLYSETILCYYFHILFSALVSCYGTWEHSVQAMLAEERIQEWGGNVELPQTQETVNKHVCHK